MPQVVRPVMPVQSAARSAARPVVQSARPSQQEDDFDAIIGGVVDAASIEPGPLVVLLYGGSKSGRTRCALTFPKPLFLVPPDEPGIETIRGAAAKYRVVGDKRDLELVIEQIEAFAGRGKLPYLTIVVDPVECLVQPVVAAWTNAANKTDWMPVMAYLKALISRMRRWGCNVVMTALPKYDKDEISGELVTGPALPGQMIQWLQRFCTAVFFLEKHTQPIGGTVKVVHRMYVHGRGIWKGGVWDPKGVLAGKEWVPPHYDEIAVPLGYPSLADLGL